MIWNDKFKASLYLNDVKTLDVKNLKMIRKKKLSQIS